MLKLGKPKLCVRKERPSGVLEDLQEVIAQAFGEEDQPNELGKLALRTHWEGKNVNETYHGKALETYSTAVAFGFRGSFRQWTELVLWADWFSPKVPLKAKSKD